MTIRQWVQRLVSMCLVMVVLSTYSMVSLAASSKPVGELTISGTAADGTSVTVNGEAAKSGRTLFGNSTISTPDGVDAILSLGGSGRLRLSPNTTFSLSSDADSIGGDLASGSLTVLSALQGVNVRTVSGELVKLNAGESVAANSSSAVRQTGPGGLEWWKWALIIGAAVTVVVIVAASRGGDDDVRPISPTR